MSLNFDAVIMNPPYDVNLHLQILNNVVEQFPESEIVNLSPCDGFINMNAATKLNDKLRNRVDSLEIMSENDANNFFAIRQSSKLGITHLTKNAKGVDVEYADFRNIIKKIRNVKSIRTAINTNERKPNQPYTSVSGNCGYVKGAHLSLQEIFTSTHMRANIVFNTQEEVDNFIWTTVNTWPYKLMYLIDDKSAIIAHLPFFDDYSHKWTNDDLYKYFNLNSDEIKKVEEIINEL